MTTSIKLKKSSVAGKSPLAGDLEYGELAINYQDGKLYYKDASNAIEAFLDSAQTTSLVRRVLLDSENAVFNDLIAGDVVFSGLQVSGITYPSVDGSADQVITTDGAGNLSFSTLDLGTDSATVISLIQDNSVDSAEVINLIDSDYVQARQTQTGIGASNTIKLDTFNGDSSTTTFALTDTPLSEQAVVVTINGVMQTADAYSLSGSNLVLSEAPHTNDEIEARTYTLQAGTVSVRDYVDYVYQPSSPITTLSGADINGKTLSYDVNKLEVYLNGVKLINSLDYTATDETSVVLLGGSVTSGDTISITSFGAATFQDNQFTPHNTDLTTTTANQVVDQFSKTARRTAKYVIQIEHDSDNKYTATEVLLTHNNSTVFITEYGTTSTDSDLATIDADISGDYVRLLVTPAYTNTTVKAKRLSFEA
jgi:hypothetical protein